MCEILRNEAGGDTVKVILEEKKIIKRIVRIKKKDAISIENKLWWARQESM